MLTTLHNTNLRVGLEEGGGGDVSLEGMTDPLNTLRATIDISDMRICIDNRFYRYTNTGSKLLPLRA